MSNASHEEFVKQRPDISIERAIAAAKQIPETKAGLSIVKSKSRLISSSDELPQVYNNPKNLTALEEGGCLFSFICHNQLTPYEAEMVDSVVNLSAFVNETSENYVPHFEYDEYTKKRLAPNGTTESNVSESSSSTTSNRPDQYSHHPKYTFLLARCGYLITGFSLETLLENSQIITTIEYQHACQPQGSKIWEDYDKMDPDTFRITKPIIPYIYSFTVQFRVSRVQQASALQALSDHLNIPIDGAILLERTKRSKPPKEDATKKLKSVLVYTDLGHGVILVTHLTVMLQVGLPEVIERIIGTIGQWGLGETAETAWRTREYLQSKMPFQGTHNDDADFLDAKSEEEDANHDGKTLERKKSSDDECFFDAIDIVHELDLSSGMAKLMCSDC